MGRTPIGLIYIALVPIAMTLNRFLCHHRRFSMAVAAETLSSDAAAMKPR